MNKVVTINLNGRAYSIEEKGYDALRAYLDDAAAQLEGNPDKDEIMADFEQAIADKCDDVLKLAGAGKNVMTGAEIEEIIKKMGPVDGAGAGEHGSEKAHGEHDHHYAKAGSENTSSAAGASSSSSSSHHQPKRLFRIYDGAVFKGVCNGIAAYFNIDPTLVRGLFVLLTIFTGGGWVLAYFILMYIMPVATTTDDIAQARGERPFTAQDFIDRAKIEYEKFANDPNMNKEQWKAKARAWKQEMHAKKHAWRDQERAKWRAYKYEGWHGAGMGASSTTNNGDGHGRGWLAAIGGTMMAVIWIVFAITLFSFLKHGVIFGLAIGAGHPIWLTILFLVAAFWLIALPFRLMLWAGHCWGGRGWHGHHHHHGGGFFGLLFTVLLIYAAIHLFPGIHAWWDSLVTYLQSVK